MTDTAATALDALKPGLAEFGDDTVTLYVPRPLIQVGGEKWRILRKNMIDQLEERDLAPRTREVLADMELEDFRGEGFVAMESPESFHTSHLNARPLAMLHRGAPFALPLLRDVGARQSAWVLALSKEEPRLYLYSGGDVIDHSARLRESDLQGATPVTLESIQERREVQDDFFFHSGSRGRLRSAEARSDTHALGTDVDAEEEKTLDAYYQLVIDALRYGLPFQVEELYVMGTEKVVGRFIQLADGDLGADFALHAVHDGESTPERIREHMRAHLDTPPERPDVALVTDTDAILDACEMGRVGELYISDGLAGLDPTSESGSEHVRLLVVGEGYGEPLADALPFNRVALAALAQGAQLHFVSESFSGAPVEAVMRWAAPGDPEGVSPEQDVEMLDEAAARQAAE